MGTAAAVEPDRPVRARVERARFALALARGSEAALVGAGALALSLAALVASGGWSYGAAGWGAAVGTACLGAASWWLEHRPRARAVARRIDAEMGFDGALLTAYEAEQRPAPPDLVRALSRRVAASLPLRAALRAALPPSMAVAAFPLAALALLALARQRVDPSQRADPGASAALALVEVGELAQLLAAERGLLGGPELEAALALATEAQRLAAGLAGEGEAQELLAGAADWMEELARSLPVQRGPVRERLERARAAADAAGGAFDARPPGEVEGGAAERGGTRGTAELTPGGPGGTMPGLDPPPELPPGAPMGPAPAAAPGSDVGLVGGRWWPKRDEELVGRWVESRRAASGER